MLFRSEVAAACLVPVCQVDGSSVRTVEGLVGAGDLSPLQAAFLETGGAQCGICTPGMLVSAAALLRERPSPSEEQVRDALGGVLCRCTGYRKIIAAVANATTFEEVPVEPAVGKAVGTRVARVDGWPKVRGEDVFGADDWPEDALLCRVIRSPHHRAGFTFGDLDAYVAANPGVVAVFTANDVPGVNRFGVIPALADQPVFAESEARFRGEAVAMVVGDRKSTRLNSSH